VYTQGREVREEARHPGHIPFGPSRVESGLGESEGHTNRPESALQVRPGAVPTVCREDSLVCFEGGISSEAEAFPALC
jgi:hypothetical protein